MLSTLDIFCPLHYTSKQTCLTLTEMEVTMIVATDRAISLAEAAGRLGVSVRTIRRMIDEGKIQAFKVLGQWRIRESEIERIMRGGSDNENDQDDQ